MRRFFGIVLLIVAACLVCCSIGMASADEFQELSDKEFEQDVEAFEETGGPQCGAHGQGLHRGLKYTLIAFGLTIFAGLFVRVSKLRILRPFFLLSGLIVFGFANGGCPCMISSMQNSILAGLGEQIRWYQPLWFLGLVPLTFIFGRVWCGWVCHLGAVQEFLYRVPGMKRFQTKNTQRILKVMQITLFAGLVLQLVVTRTNEFIHIDPFKVVFNLMAGNAVSIVLLVLLLTTSLFIYRPFCRGVCPVGLILGWVGKIPGALRLASSADCTKCKACSRTCRIQAIGMDIELDPQECIMCGRCLDQCPTNAIKFTRKDHVY